RVLGADAGVVEPGADRVRLADLSLFVLEEQRPGAVEDTRNTSVDGGAVPARLGAEPARLDADETHVWQIDEPRERADGVRAPADARHDEVRVGPVEDLAGLLARLVADDALELAHHPRERMRADDGADAVVRRLDARDPVAQRLVDCVLQRR